MCLSLSDFKKGQAGITVAMMTRIRQTMVWYAILPQIHDISRAVREGDIEGFSVEEEKRGV